MKELAQYIKILGDASRLAIILTIDQGSMSVTEIIKATGLSQTLASFHLRTLRNAALVKTRRKGPFIYYRLADPGLIDALETLSRVARLDIFSKQEAPCSRAMSQD